MVISLIMEVSSSTESTSLVFFDRKMLDHRRRKPKPLVYQIYLCSKCQPDGTSDQEIGAWCALIVQQPQNTLGASSAQTTYMISGMEESNSHIRIRLQGILEALKWITANISEEQYASVEATFISNDVFAVNMLREWIPKWAKSSYKMGSKTQRTEELRPNYDILQQISLISTGIKLIVKWQSERSHYMTSLMESIDDILAPQDLELISSTSETSLMKVLEVSEHEEERTQLKDME